MVRRYAMRFSPAPNAVVAMVKLVVDHRLSEHDELVILARPTAEQLLGTSIGELFIAWDAGSIPAPAAPGIGWRTVLCCLSGPHRSRGHGTESVWS